MRNQCIVCGAPLFEKKLLVCNHMPKAAQHFPDETSAMSDQPIDFNLMQCSGCGLVQLDVEPVEYYRDVIRSGGYSTTMHQLRHEQYERFLHMCPMEGKRIIEVGCGQGEFLRIWREDRFPVKAYGIEHDKKLVELAQRDNLNVDVGFAENEETVIEGAPFEGFCSFNFLEHQPAPNGMLRCVYNNLKDEAYGLITVPSWEYIVEQQSYYELIRDHIAYYSKESFCFLLEKNGFRVISCREVNRDTWEAIVEKKRLQDVSAMRENRQALKNQVDTLLETLKAQGKRLAIWGASHQGLTILSSMDLQTKVAYVIDSAPFKQGRLTIGSHIPIVPPAYINENQVDAILIIAPGYTEEIAESIRMNYDLDIEIYVLRSNQMEKYD